MDKQNYFDGKSFTDLPSKPVDLLVNQENHWIHDPAFNKSNIARNCGLSPQRIHDKLRGFNNQRLTDKNLELLEVERIRLLKVLGLTDEHLTLLGL